MLYMVLNASAKTKKSLSDLKLLFVMIYENDRCQTLLLGKMNYMVNIDINILTVGNQLLP